LVWSRGSWLIIEAFIEGVFILGSMLMLCIDWIISISDVGAIRNCARSVFEVWAMCIGLYGAC